ncbi:MAG: hypothetical protein HY665_06415 [Chloroflexi bacterium]|nr:hypothetical protein [Chloroflexota bacterium]
MAKGPRIDDEMRRAIAAIHRSHPDWRIKEVKAEADRLYEGRAPGFSAVQKELAKITLVEETPAFKYLDRPWSMGTLSKFPIPPEAIPKLLEIQRNFSSSHSISSTSPNPSTNMIPSCPLTIREARWVANLHVQIEDKILLWMAAHAYASYEERCDLAGQDCDTSDLDAKLPDEMGGAEVFKIVMDRILGEGWADRITDSP